MLPPGLQIEEVRPADKAVTPLPFGFLEGQALLFHLLHERFDDTFPLLLRLPLLFVVGFLLANHPLQGFEFLARRVLELLQPLSELIHILGVTTAGGEDRRDRDQRHCRTPLSCAHKRSFCM